MHFFSLGPCLNLPEWMLVQQVVGVPRIVFYTEAPPAPSEAAHIAAEVPTELSATAEQGVFNPVVSPPTSGAGVNSGLLKHQQFKRRYVSSLFSFKYKQLSSSRKTSPLYSELVSYYKRPMGMSNNHRLRYRIHTNSCSSNPPTTPPLLRGGDSCYGQRDQVLARQKGDSKSPSVRKRTRICKFPVHGSQERWGSKACHKLSILISKWKGYTC